MTDGKRNYKKERDWEKGKPGDPRNKDRAKRNAARKDLGLKVGDPRHADHKKELTNGGKNTLANLHAISAKANLQKEAKRKQRASKK
jgi:hypothetical protein